MAKSNVGFDPAAYAPVAERIRLFWESFPTGRIATRLVSRTEHEVIFEARIYRSAEEAEPAATGWAAEREGDGDVNAVACLENTETSAVGRALANLGFTAARERPSIEEMQKAARARARLAVARPTSRVAERASPETTRPLPADTVIRARDRPQQAYADLVADLLRLLESAERYGLRRGRSRRWSEALLSRQFSPDLLMGYERRLRAWVAGQAGRADP
jgi:hypothetical protein